MSFKLCGHENSGSDFNPGSRLERDSVVSFKARLRSEVRHQHQISRQISDFLDRIREARSDVATLVEHQGKCVAMSPDAAKILGIFEEELLGKSLLSSGRLTEQSARHYARQQDVFFEPESLLEIQSEDRRSVRSFHFWVNRYAVGSLTLNVYRLKRLESESGEAHAS